MSFTVPLMYPLRSAASSTRSATRPFLWVLWDLKMEPRPLRCPLITRPMSAAGVAPGQLDESEPVLTGGLAAGMAQEKSRCSPCNLNSLQASQLEHLGRSRTWKWPTGAQPFYKCRWPGRLTDLMGQRCRFEPGLANTCAAQAGFAGLCCSLSSN